MKITLALLIVCMVLIPLVSTYNQNDIMAQAICSGFVRFNSWVMAIRKTCGRGPNCHTICRDPRLRRQDNQGHMMKNPRCVEAIRIYENRPQMTRPRQVGLKVGIWARCSDRGCGPNYCCCTFTE